MRKRFAVLLVTALSVSLLAGCGSKSGSAGKTSKVEIELADLIENVADATTEIRDLQVDINGELDISVKVDGQSVAAQGSVSMKGKAVKDEPAFDADGTVKYSATYSGATLSGEYSAKASGVTEDGQLNVYARLDKGDEKGDWLTDSMDASLFTDYFSGLDELLKDGKDDFESITEEDWALVESVMKLEDTTQIVNKRECYVVSVKINRDTILELIAASEDYVDEEEKNEALAEAEETFEQLDLDCTGRICYDKNTFLPVQTAFSFTMNGEVEETEVNIKKLSLEINMVANDNISIDKIPDDVRENAEQVDMGLEDIFGDDEYEGWEYDDDDYDYEDYDDYDYEDYDDEDGNV